MLCEKNESYGIDSEGKVTLYLQQWSESKFVDAATRLAVQSLANREPVERLAKENSATLRSDLARTTKQLTQSRCIPPNFASNWRKSGLHVGSP